MAEAETMGVLDEIQHLVSDKLQVVSYKWLSRNFSMSSDDAKRLLQDFAKRHGTGVEVLYTLAGWKKNDPSLYRVRLASKNTLAEAKQEFDEDCSVEIYSVQACVPKDPAVLWNVEFLQAGELFKQSHAVDNCLLDNRFCRVSNSFVKRNGRGTWASTMVSQVKSAGTLGSSVKTLANQSPGPAQPCLKKVQESSKLQSSDGPKDAKNKSHISGACEQNIKPAQEEGNVSELPINIKKADNKSSGNGGALANMWGRASSKVKTESVSAETNSTHNSSDAQIAACEEEHHSSDDEFQGVKRPSHGQTAGRKRKFVLDDSDDEYEYKDAVNLASPDPPKKSLTITSKQTFHSSELENNKLNFEEEKEKPNANDGNEADRVSNKTPKEKSLALINDDNKKAFSLEIGATVNNVPAGTTLKNKMTDSAPKSPQRRKVLKTRIDERGREVTEVVWEGDEAERKSDSSITKKVDNVAPSNAGNRPSANKKSPAVANNATLNQAGKAGNKKAVNKDPKQGNIMSFFKKK